MLFGIGCLLLGIIMEADSAEKMISCPAVTLKQYGKLSYYDAKIGRFWSLHWQNKEFPVWSSVSIPQTTTCGTGKASSGIHVTYQCAVFECQSNAVIASLKQNQTLKCFSAYASTKNTFYCNGFSAKQ